MAGNPYLWSTTAATNATADGDINWAEGQLPGTVNESARGMMAGEAGLLKDNNATVTTTNASNVYAATSNIAVAGLATGLRLRLKINFTNTGTATLNLTPAGGAAFGAKSIRKFDATNGEIDVAAGDLRINGIYDLNYDSTANSAAGAWIVLNPSQLPTPGLVFIASTTAVTSAAVDFTSGISSTYEEYLIVGSNLHPATDATELWMRISDDAGSTFKSGGSDYKWAFSIATDASSGSDTGSTADSKIKITTANSSSTANSISFEARMYAPAGTTSYKLMRFDSVSITTGPNLGRWAGAGAYVGGSNNAINAIRFMSSSGNLSGEFALYGVRKT